MNVWLMILLEFFITSIMSTFNFSVAALSIKRTFNEMPVSLIENSVFVVDIGIKYNATLDKQRLEENVKTYLTLNLKNTVSKYKIGFTYYVFDENHQYVIDFSDAPMNVDISFQCEYLNLVKLNYYRSFELINLYDEREIDWIYWK